MRPACRLVAEALELARELIRPGVTTGEIDSALEELIRAGGGEPLFKGYPAFTPGVAPFPGTICASVNDEVVHGIPGSRELKEGDIFSIDVGARLGGWCGDAARTFPVGEISRKAEKLLELTEECVSLAVGAMRPGARLSQVSGVIQRHAEDAGFSVVRDFVGHGIGREMHEPPQVPNYVRGLGSKLRDGDFSDLELQAGLVLAVEPMVNVGASDVRLQKNGWTVVTKDHSLSAHFEHTIAVTETGAAVLTAL